MAGSRNGRRGRNRPNNNNSGRPQQRQQNTPAPLVPFVEVPSGRTRLDGTSGTAIMVPMPSVPRPLDVRTHVKYHIASHNNFMMRAKPNSNMITGLARQSGWIKVQDWDDVEIVPLVDGDIHVEFAHRGFVQA